MDITFTGLPNEIGEQQAKEWMAILVERFANAKINQIPEVVAATEAAKSTIDTFRVANSLTAKFAKPEAEKPIEKVEDAITAG